MDPLYQFRWWRPEGGFCLERDQTVLAYAQNAGTEQAYFPLEQEPALFLTFCDTAATAEGMLEFANRFGRLGIKSARPHTLRNLGQIHEPIEGWLRAHAQLQAAVKLWQAIRNRDAKTLAAQIVWAKSKVLWEPPVSDLMASFHAGDEIYSRFPHGALVQPAEYFLQHLINKQLTAETTPSLLWRKQENGKRALGIHLCPRSLVAALWLQLAQAVTDKQGDFRRCAWCASWVLLAPGRSRRDRKYCSNACRQARLRFDRKHKSRRRNRTVRRST